MSARSSAARLLRRSLRKSGRDLVPYRVATHPVARRMHLLGRSGVNVVFDVGANAGQYGRGPRDAGYYGRIR